MKSVFSELDRHHSEYDYELDKPKVLLKSIEEIARLICTEEMEHASKAAVKQMNGCMRGNAANAFRWRSVAAHYAFLLHPELRG